VHNGSLSNHNRLREQLARHGERFQTDNDSEVAAAYLASRMRAGDTLQGALENGLKDLDGFYTFVVGTRDGFAVIRDPIACKPAVIAETDDWVAMASEYRAIAPLPGAEHATHLGAGARDRLCLEPRRLMVQARRSRSRNSVLDLAQMTLREVNQLLHDNRAAIS
jgi:glutamine phosphoribosylpyrophosphate amidotransferase